MEILQKHRYVLQFLKKTIYPWRKLTTGIDGADGVGKSPLAWFLSWQLGMPTLNTDMFILPGRTGKSPRYNELATLIEWRHSADYPVIVEGIFLLETLEKIDVLPDVLIYVVNDSWDGSDRLKPKLAQYRALYDPEGKADYIYKAEKEDFRDG